MRIPPRSQVFRYEEVDLLFLPPVRLSLPQPEETLSLRFLVKRADPPAPTNPQPQTAVQRYEAAQRFLASQIQQQQPDFWKHLQAFWELMGPLEKIIFLLGVGGVGVGTLGGLSGLVSKKLAPWLGLGGLLAALGASYFGRGSPLSRTLAGELPYAARILSLSEQHPEEIAFHYPRPYVLLLEPRHHEPLRNQLSTWLGQLRPARDQQNRPPVNLNTLRQNIREWFTQNQIPLPTDTDNQWFANEILRSLQDLSQLNANEPGRATRIFQAALRLGRFLPPEHLENFLRATVPQDLGVDLEDILHQVREEIQKRYEVGQYLSQGQFPPPSQPQGGAGSGGTSGGSGRESGAGNVSDEGSDEGWE